ncbi:hypothetical protein R3P38DRAFT_3197236 [Favolaschia claudopus]|uniref:Uncharacterized protein n=1 Tax=Favolaschia claudopus TaxID=2862362 RepID=A0AAW0B5T1_9AGAR
MQSFSPSFSPDFIARWNAANPPPRPPGDVYAEDETVYYLLPTRHWPASARQIQFDASEEDNKIQSRYKPSLFDRVVPSLRQKYLAARVEQGSSAAELRAASLVVEKRLADEWRAWDITSTYFLSAWLDRHPVDVDLWGTSEDPRPRPPSPEKQPWYMMADTSGWSASNGWGGVNSTSTSTDVSWAGNNVWGGGWGSGGSAWGSLQDPEPQAPLRRRRHPRLWYQTRIHPLPKITT